jgi:hypothetical protein
MTHKRRFSSVAAYVALLFAVLLASVLLFLLRTSVLSWPPFVLLLAMMALGAAIGVILHFTLSRLSGWLFGIMHIGEHNEIAGHFLGIIGVIYGVVLAFVVVTAWQEFHQTEDLVAQEQRGVNSLFHLMRAYEKSDQTTESDQAVAIQWLLRDYAANSSREWQQMQASEHPLCPSFVFRTDIDSPIDTCRGSNHQVEFLVVGKNFSKRLSSESTNCLANEILERVPDMRSTTTGSAAFFVQSMSLAENLVEDRNERLNVYDAPPLATVLWLAFPLGALILICMTYFITNQDSRSQLVRTSALCAMIGLMVALALIFDYPFTGSSSIDGSGWSTLVQQFDRHIAQAMSARAVSGAAKSVSQGTAHTDVGGGATPQEPVDVSNACSPIRPSRLSFSQPKR